MDENYVQLLFNSAGYHPLVLYDDGILGNCYDEKFFGIKISCISKKKMIPIKVVRLAAHDQFILDGKFDIHPDSCVFNNILIEDISNLDNFIDYSPQNLVYFGFYVSNIQDIRLKVTISLKNPISNKNSHFSCYFTGFQLISQSLSSVIGSLLTEKSNDVVGHLCFDYIVVKPWEGYANFCDLPKIELNQLKKPILIGHRGSGSSYNESPSRYMENTMDSFMRATDCGAKFIELDVQLTRDHQVIIYHDFLTEPITSFENANDVEEDLKSHLDIPIRDLKYSQLKLHKFTHAAMPSHNEKNGRTNVTSSTRTLGCMFPLLEDVLKTLPPNVGINVELKFPQQGRDGSWELEGSYFDRNLMAEKVLSVVFNVNKDIKRPIIFSSFDPAMCVMMAHKQKIYPVLFLVEEINDPLLGYLDFRTRAVKTAILFAFSEKMHGICSSVDSILSIIGNVAHEVHSRGLALFTYGSENNNIVNIVKQANAGVDGIIFDRIYDFLPDLLVENSLCDAKFS